MFRFITVAGSEQTRRTRQWRTVQDRVLLLPFYERSFPAANEMRR